jgi:predicted ester cyclase
VSEENKVIVRRAFEEVWNQGNLDILGEIFSASFVSHHPRNRDEDIHGIDAYKNWVLKIRGVCPDLKLDVVNLFSEGNEVMSHLKGQVTYRGRVGNLDPTGKQITSTVTAIIRLADNKIAECWIIADSLGIMQQVGVLAPIAQGS